MNKNHKKRITNKKIPSSGVRVLELLKVLLNGEVSSKDFFMIIEEKGDILFKKEAMWKYINTLKLFGFDILKEKDKYRIDNILDLTDYTETDLSVIKFIDKYISQINLKSIENNLQGILPKIEKSFSQDTLKLIRTKKIKPCSLNILSSSKENAVRKYEQYCLDGLKLIIKYKTTFDEEETYKISPLKIIYKNQKAVLVGYDCQNCEYKEFLLDLITQDKQTPQKVAGNFSSNVIFKLKDRLAKSYVLKKEEKLLEYNKNYAVISNSKEDKSLLMRRLLRYYDKCEVTYPKTTREEMLKLIEDIEKIYD